VLFLPLRDLSSGLRMYRRDVVERMALQAPDFDVLGEIQVRAHNAGWRIIEVPFRHNPLGSCNSHTRLITLGWAHLKTLVRMRRLRHGQAETRSSDRTAASMISKPFRNPKFEIRLRAGY
jgi:hypothetical protein